MKTMLVPVDFSEATATTVATAVSLAKACAGEIVLVHVITPPVENIQYPVLNDDIWEQAITLARRNLNRILASIHTEGVGASAKTIGGFPVETILAQGRECGADMIVMGSHGHTAIYDLLVGSTSSGVLKGSSCPVLLVPVQKARPSEKPELAKAV